MAWWQIAAHVGALVPLAVLVWDYAHDNLTVNPIQEATFRTGKYALVLLVLSLACTPANVVFGLRQALRLRRALGLYAFLYAGMHFLIFVWIDYGLDLALLKEAIFEKRFALVGFAAFMILLPLAITSTKGWQRRLKKRWTRLHQLAYLAGILAVIHFVWLVKSDVREPLLYGAAVLALLVIRVPAVRGVIKAVRARVENIATGGRWQRQDRPSPESHRYPQL
ncbi:MAG: sulfoxide reductase heme-binding subunit YedZ [Anaerolineae bacterium]|nr:sulfoxide reductase heme-binding subunit YedZ [Anaerolineae bacterium]